MVKKPLILDPSEFDFDNVVSDIEEIRKYNRQRFEMEQLTAIFYEDHENGVTAGYKDLAQDEFWVRGHMPGMPLMPGVIMCEVAAQIASYHCQRHGLIEGTLGFGGLDDVRFRGMVRPGDRFAIVCRLLKARRMMVTCEFQGFVGETKVCDGLIKGIVLPVDLLTDE